MNEFEVRGSYDLGFIRRQITDHMKSLRFSEKEIAEVSIVVNELCDNMIKHAAVEGKIRFSQIVDENRTGIEIVAEDKGPGIENIEEMLKDGVSSKGTLGGGFGAIRRLSDYFEIRSNTKSLGDSTVQPGTIIVVKKWRASSLHTSRVISSDITVSVLTKPYYGSSVNGDGYYIRSSSGKDIIAVLDGLGHGVEAFEATNCAIKIIDENTHKSVEEIMKTMNLVLKNKRGAVVALFSIDRFEKEFEMLSIGNIDIRLMSEEATERLFSYNGYIGGYTGNFKTTRHAYKRGDILTLCTDGVSTKWEFEQYINENISNPTVLCNLVFNEYARQNDDATMLVAVL